MGECEHSTRRARSGNRPVGDDLLPGKAISEGIPWIGGAVDWLRVEDGAALADMLRRGGYTHVIYESRGWETLEGGEEMKRVIADAEARRYLVPVRRFEPRLYASRATGLYRTTLVTVLEVSPAPVARPKSAAMASATMR